MRIKQCAEVAGTTVRTIRYYHQIGLVPVPDERRGRRDYQLTHVARVMRIRWLAEAGIDLATIAELLDAEATEPHTDPTTHPVRDLRATADGIRERIAELQSQERRIQTLIAMAERGEELSALPLPVHDFYSRVEQATSDPRALRVLRRERDLAELIALRGALPDVFGELLAAMDEAAIERIVSFYVRFAALGEAGSGAPQPDPSAAVDDLIDDLEHWWVHEEPELVDAFLERMPAWLRRPGSLDVLGRLARQAYPDPRQDDVIRRTMPRFIRYLQERR
ncbi:MerR family transcriptional regulator [Ornithinimicrobium sp. Y1694]|uniref:MerR family transcriptional regulator n=1 Tax=Ornithinimicrobium sp. Y1694 TaxID=3418590 RepID=UPI003CF0D674